MYKQERFSLSVDEIKRDLTTIAEIRDQPISAAAGSKPMVLPGMRSSN